MRKIEWVNALRGVAAMLVIVAHLGVYFWLDRPTSEALARTTIPSLRTTEAPVASFLGGLPVAWGGLGVALFFVISGYVIAISLNRYSRTGFLIGRLTRIIPTYAVGYLVTCAVVAISGDPNRELNPASIGFGMIPGLPMALQLPALADGIVWTLTIELVFYALCLIAYRRLAGSAIGIVLAAAGCVAVQFALQNMHVPSVASGLARVLILACPFIPVMLVGVAASAWHERSISVIQFAGLVPLLIGVHMLTASTNLVAPQTLTYHLTFVAVMVVFVVLAVLRPGWKRTRVADYFADISYPLYVCHNVLGFAVIALLLRLGVSAGVAFVGAVLTVLAVATALHYAVERPTHRLGRRWASRFNSRHLEPANR